MSLPASYPFSQVDVVVLYVTYKWSERVMQKDGMGEIKY